MIIIGKMQKVEELMEKIRNMDAIQKQLVQSFMIKLVGRVCMSCRDQGFAPGSAGFTPDPTPPPASFDVHKDCHICYRRLA